MHTHSQAISCVIHRNLGIVTWIVFFHLTDNNHSVNSLELQLESSHDVERLLPTMDKNIERTCKYSRARSLKAVSYMYSMEFMPSVIFNTRRFTDILCRNFSNRRSAESVYSILYLLSHYENSTDCHAISNYYTTFGSQKSLYLQTSIFIISLDNIFITKLNPVSASYCYKLL